MYTKEGTPVENPDANSGLYIRDRNGRIVRAPIPADHIAYQMGEAMQVCAVIIGRSDPSLGPGWLRANINTEHRAHG